MSAKHRLSLIPLAVLTLTLGLTGLTSAQVEEAWVARYNGPANNADEARKVAVDGSGNVYVTGDSHNGSNYDYLTLKYDAGGNLLWERRYNGPANSTDRAFALSVDGSGNVYVTGDSYNSSGATDYLTLKYTQGPPDTATIARQIALGLGRYPSAGGYLEVRNNALANYSHRGWPRVNWPWYNSNYGETFVAVGDIDGDGWDEIVVGLGSGSGGWIEVFDDVRSGYAHMAWLQVPWSWYNNVNGETRPAVGDMDGDGKAEIVVGLGRNSGGYMFVFDDATAGFAPKTWLRVNWSAYNNANGETRPAVGDVDGDGKAEIVVGYGTYTSSGGWMPVLDDATKGYAFMRGLYIPWSAYNSANGETRPAVGDIDGDGKAEVLVGLGTYKSNGGWMYIFDDATAGFASKGWLRIPWSTYNSANGETRPTVGDTDGNGKAEIVVGLGTSSGGWFLTFHGVDGSTATVYWNQIPRSAYNSAVGSSQPAVGRLAP